MRNVNKRFAAPRVVCVNFMHKKNTRAYEYCILLNFSGSLAAGYEMPIKRSLPIY